MTPAAKIVLKELKTLAKTGLPDMRKAFSKGNRFAEFSAKQDDLLLDYSKCRVTQKSMKLGVIYRPSYHLTFDTALQRNDIDLPFPMHAFVTNLVTSRVGYAFNTRTFLDTLLQYNTDLKQLSANVRFLIMGDILSAYLATTRRTSSRSSHSRHISGDTQHPEIVPPHDKQYRRPQTMQVCRKPACLSKSQTSISSAGFLIFIQFLRRRTRRSRRLAAARLAP